MVRHAYGAHSTGVRSFRTSAQSPHGFQASTVLAPPGGPGSSSAPTSRTQQTQPVAGEERTRHAPASERSRVRFNGKESISLGVLKQATANPLEVAYDAMLANGGANDGKGLLYFPIFNYSYGDLSQLHTQLQHPRTMMSLADGGAHVGYVCDVSMPTFMLTHWARDRTRGPKLSLEMLVKKQTRDTAEVYGLHDRGLIAPGMKADLNIINFDALTLDLPHFVYDLPAGGGRLTQSANGYLATLVAGQAIMENGAPTGAMPGALVRGPQRA